MITYCLFSKRLKPSINSKKEDKPKEKRKKKEKPNDSQEIALKNSLNHRNNADFKTDGGCSEQARPFFAQMDTQEERKPRKNGHNKEIREHLVSFGLGFQRETE